MFCFFFQAEDGIRDGRVTGVQTCALPIWSASFARMPPARDSIAMARRWFVSRGFLQAFPWANPRARAHTTVVCAGCQRKIGRASCRERVKSLVVTVGVKLRAEILILSILI